MKILYFVVVVMMAFAWLSPFHAQPWASFGNEFAGFAAGLTLLTLFLKQELKVPTSQLWFLPIILIPLLQWACGLVFYFSVALFSTLYLFSFWLMVVVGFNLSLITANRERLMQHFSYLLLGVAVLSSLIAMIQWLNLEDSVYGVMRLDASRPYANFGQPNHLATFLVMGLLAALYLYEKNKAALWCIIPSSCLIIFSIALTQSRTSWVVCVFIFLYWLYKKNNIQARLSTSKLLLWCVTFFVLAAYLVPVLNKFMLAMGFDVAHTASIAERATSGYERIQIWQQFLHAIVERPWFGYGWEQTSIAQMAVFHVQPTYVWVKSAHNIILDLLIWNGIPLGALIIGCMAVWLYWLNKNAKDITSVVAMLMVCVVVIHCMLEFPHRYSYFLLPVGFLLGLIQAQTLNSQTITIPKNIVGGCWMILFFLLLLIGRDYKLAQLKVNSVFTQPQSQLKFLGVSRLLILNQFQELIDFALLNPKTKLSEADFVIIENIVNSNPTAYNLMQYALLLSYNNKDAEAENQLFKLNRLHKQNISLEDLHKLTRKN